MQKADFTYRKYFEISKVLKLTKIHFTEINKIQIHSCKVSDMENDYFNVVTDPRFENIL